MFYTSLLSFLPVFSKDLWSVTNIVPQLWHFDVSAGSWGMMPRPTELFLLSAADRNKDLSCTPKIAVSQTSSWGRENALYRQCAKCCTTTCDSPRAKWPKVTGCEIEVWGYVRRLELFGVTRICWEWLSSALPSLVWETAELLHMKSHPSSQIIAMHRYIYASVWVAWGKHLTWRMPSQSIQIWWRFKQKKTESYNGK